MRELTESIYPHEDELDCTQRSSVWNSPPKRVCTILKEEQIRRTPVMGIKAEARRLSYIKHRQLRRNQSTLSRRSIHRGRRAWFRKKERPLAHNAAGVGESQRKHQSGVEWAKTVINRLSFNKLFRK